MLVTIPSFISLMSIAVTSVLFGTFTTKAPCPVMTSEFFDPFASSSEKGNGISGTTSGTANVINSIFMISSGPTILPPGRKQIYYIVSNFYIRFKQDFALCSS